MRHILSTFLLLSGFSGIAQSELEPQIQHIKRAYRDIQEHYRDYDKDSVEFWDESTDGGQIISYKQRDTLRLLSVTWFGESGMRQKQFYFENNKIFFVFDQIEQYNSPYYVNENYEDMDAFDRNKSTFVENRYYFADDSLIRWIDPKNNPIDLTLAESRTKGQHELLQGHRYYIRLLEDQIKVKEADLYLEKTSPANPFGNGDFGSGGSGSFGSAAAHTEDTSVYRYVVDMPNFDGMVIKHDADIYLELVVDQHGKVVKALNIFNKSTTMNETVINEVKRIVKRDMKFNVTPGTDLYKVTMKFELNAP